MRKELEYFDIEGEYGWNQDDFKDFWMKEGGCACVTACDSMVYMKKHMDKVNLYPYDTQTIRKEEYVAFTDTVKPYIRPRWMGVDKLDIYTEGIGAYFQNIGEHSVRLAGFDGNHTLEEAKEAIRNQIDAGFPIPCLILLHKNPRFKDYTWHWFLLNGYEIFEDEFMVKAVTYGSYRWLDLRGLWHTGHRRKGGLILFSAA